MASKMPFLESQLFLLLPLLLLLLFFRLDLVFCADGESGGAGVTEAESSTRPTSQYNKTQQERMLKMLEQWRSQVKMVGGSSAFPFVSLFADE